MVEPFDVGHLVVAGGMQVAEWAGQSVEVLLRNYAKCLDGGLQMLRQRVEAALGHRAI